jgi:hypothetical protein
MGNVLKTVGIVALFALIGSLFGGTGALIGGIAGAVFESGMLDGLIDKGKSMLGLGGNSQGGPSHSPMRHHSLGMETPALDVSPSPTPIVRGFQPIQAPDQSQGR